MPGRLGAAQRLEFACSGSGPVSCQHHHTTPSFPRSPPPLRAQVPGPDDRVRIRKNLHPREGWVQTHSRKWSWRSVMANWQTDS